MKLTLRTVAAGMLIAAAGLTAYPSLAEDAGVDFWHVPDLHLGISAAETERQELDREEVIVMKRTALRYETVGDVAEGRLSFEEGITRFVELNRTNPTAMRHVRSMYPGATDEARAAWQLVGHLQNHPNPKAKAAADAGVKWMAERF